MINFHAAQIEISKFRRNRIKEFKKVFPSIGTKKQVKTKTGEETDGFPLIASSQTKNLQAQKKSKSGRVSDSIAPPTMFQRMKGNTNSDVIEEVYYPRLGICAACSQLCRGTHLDAGLSERIFFALYFLFEIQLTFPSVFLDFIYAPRRQLDISTLMVSRLSISTPRRL